MKWTIACFIFLLFNTAFADNLNSDIYVRPDAYLFTSSYLLHNPSSSSDLSVKLTTSRRAYFAQQVHLCCKVQGKERIIRILPKKNGQCTFLQMTVPQSSKWHGVLKKFGKKIALKYYAADVADTLLKPKQLKLRRSSLAMMQIKPLSHSKLETSYTVHNTSQHAHSPKRIRVHVSIITDYNKKGKKELIGVATFYIREIHAVPLCAKAVPVSIPKSIIKFEHTKRGLQEISKKHIKRSSVWYLGAKKAVEESVRKYLRFEQVHEEKLGKRKVKSVDAVKDELYLSGAGQ